MPIQPISQQTLENIGGQTTQKAAQGMLQTAMNAYSVYSDIQDRQMKRESHDKEMELADLNIEIKKQKGVGSAAIGVLDMLDRTKNPMNFIEQYRTYRDNAPEGVKEMLPEGFQNPEQARMWANQQAAQADKLLPYLTIQAKESSMKQWEFTTSLLAKDPETLTPAEQRYLDYNAKADTNIYVGTPSKAKLESTIMDLSTLTVPDSDQKLLESLDQKSRVSFTSAVSNMADQIVASSGRTPNPIDRTTAVNMAVKELGSRIVKVDTLREDIPFIGDYFDKEYAFVPPEVEKEITAKAATPETPIEIPDKTPSTLKVGEVMEYEGYEWRRNSNGQLQKRKIN